MPDWNSLKLVTELQQKSPSFHARLTTVADYVKPLLGHTRPIGSEEFTDHDFAHSTRIAHRIAQILPSTCTLNGSELYLLLLAVLLHDSGMWGPKEEVLKLPDDASFREWAERSHSLSWKQVQEDLAFQPRRWMGEIGLRHLAAIWFRLNHPARLGSFVFDRSSPTGSTLRVLIGENYIRHVATIAVAHSWDRARVLEDESLDPQEIGAEPVNLRFLASLLRLGDLLDLGEGRISTLLWDYLRPLNAVSEMHWRKEHTLRVRNCSPDLIEVEGHFDIDHGGLTTSEAYRLALEWLDWLEAEIKDCARIVHTRVPQEYESRCRLGKLEFDDTRVKANGLVTGQRIAFELNRRRILELLGDEIYSTGSVFVRELLQNALDATRAQIVRDHHREMQDDPVTYPPDRPWDWPHSVTGTDRYAIDANVTEEKDARGRDLILFTVTDRGTGMTLKQISNHFLQVGVSYYQSDQFKTEFRFKPISRFGIGFLSCLTVAQPEGRIEVLTRAAGEPAGLKLSIQLPSDQYLITKDETLPQGTTVKVWIDPKADHPPGWNSPPIHQEDVALAVGVPVPTWPIDEVPEPCPRSLERLLVACQQWVLYHEMQMVFGLRARFPRIVAFPREAHILVQDRLEQDRFVRPPPLPPNSGKLPEGGLKQFHPKSQSRPRSSRQRRRLRRHFEITKAAGNSSSEIRLPITSPTGQHLGHATWIHRTYASGLPTEIEVSTLDLPCIHSHRSLFLWNNAVGIRSHMLVWNSTRLPKRCLSAGRLLRSDLFGFTQAVRHWLQDWVMHIYAELMRRSVDIACLWRLLVSPDSGGVRFNLPDVRYPVRTSSGLQWLTEKEINSFKAVLLVPFGIAWLKTPVSSIPVVGVLNNERDELNRDYADFDMPWKTAGCRSVEFAPYCTALLWPPDSRIRKLRFFCEGVTHVRGDIRIEGDARKRYRIQQSRQKKEVYVNPSFEPNDFPEYDREESPWQRYNLEVNRGLGFKDSFTGRRANELLHNAAPIHMPEELLRVVIPDGDEWE